MGIAVIGRAFLAIAAGFVTIAVLITAVNSLLARMAPEFVKREGRPRLQYMVVNVLASAAFALEGGWITARLAPVPGNPLTLSLMLALAVLVMSALSAMQMRGQQPATYQLALIVISPLAVVAGGMIRMMQMGYRW
jgi:hypothetical protein